jgi:myosin heavy subunit
MVANILAMFFWAVQSSLDALMTTLYRCEPHFVRCMKSNHQKKGNIFESDMMMAQLRYAGTQC